MAGDSDMKTNEFAANSAGSRFSSGFRFFGFWLLGFWLLAPGFCYPQSVASKNRTGNQFFDQGKYAEAEKAYLEAQSKDSGRPELSYNLGKDRRTCTK